MQLNNLHIKELIQSYVNNPESIYVHRFQEGIYQYVKWWPKRKYYCDDDICQDFLVYVIEFTEQIMCSFPLDSDVSFVTWFNAVLSNKFNDFTKVGIVSKQDFVLGSYAIDNIISAPISESSNTDILGIIDKLTIAEAGVVLFCSDPNQVHGEHLKGIALLVKRALQDIFAVYQEVLKEHCIIAQQKESYYNKIKSIDHKIVHMKNIIDRQNIYNDRIKLLSDKIKRLENRRYKQVRFLERIHHSHLGILISLFLDYDIAYRTSKKLQRKIKKIILESK